MIQSVFDYLLRRRAERVFAWLAPHLPDAGTLLDIGCGTGHNAALIRRRLPGLDVREADVVAMTPPGRPSPLLIVDGRIPLASASVDVGLMLYVLHYARDPAAALREARRVVRDRLILLQTTADDAPSRLIWRCRDACMGRWACRVCGLLGLVAAGECSMRPATFFDRRGLNAILLSAGWRVRSETTNGWPGTMLRRNLLVLERA